MSTVGPQGEHLVASVIDDSGHRLHVIVFPFARRVSIHDHRDPFAHAGRAISLADARRLGEALVKAADDVMGPPQKEEHDGRV